MIDARDFVFGPTKGSVTLTGTWNPSCSPLELVFDRPRRMEQYFVSYRLFGIHWWQDRMSYDARIRGWNHESGEMSFEIVSPVTYTRSEWWRRAGCAVIDGIRRAVGLVWRQP